MRFLREAKGVLWGSAILLILVQLIGGMRDMPQFPFFLIYLEEQLNLAPTTISGVVSSGQIAGMIAAELGADVAIAKAGGLLHDLGKAIDHEVEGTHALIGADFAKRYGVNARIVNAIASHHHEVEQEYVESYIVEAADAISGARPGARRESMETYIKRVKTLEDIANSFDGVEQSYALQAGREVRIIVRPEAMDDYSSLQLARDVARKIEESMQYPGQIKVQVIRETRAVDYAK